MHVLGKGCYEDFMWFDLEDMTGRLAILPAQDHHELVAMIPGVQHWNHNQARLAPVPIEIQKVVSVDVVNPEDQP
jgi:hypothetical protein